MRWEAPIYLLLLLVLPLLAIGTRLLYRKVRVRRRSWFDDEVFARLGDRESRGLHATRGLLFYSGLALLVVALAGPRIGTEIREVKRQGADILVALDLSNSMKAEDVRPNRLGKAKFELVRLVDRLKGDRIGLLVFTGESLLQVPLTHDYAAFRLFLNIADTDLMPSGATEYRGMLATAAQAFAPQEGAPATAAAKVLLVLSDGEDHGPAFATELQALREMGVTVFAVGIGTTAGGAIPIYGADGRLREYKRDNAGQVVTTSLQRESLRTLASGGGGAFYEILRAADGLDPFLGRLETLDKAEFATAEYADFENRYRIPGALGLMLLVGAFLLPRTRPTA